MAKDLSSERVGIQSAARLLGVRVSELKGALRQGTDLKGHPPPQPIIRGAGSTGTQMLFRLSDVMAAAEKIGKG